LGRRDDPAVRTPRQWSVGFRRQTRDESNPRVRVRAATDCEEAGQHEAREMKITDYIVIAVIIGILVAILIIDHHIKKVSK
jgi:hypothetical protein